MSEIKNFEKNIQQDIERGAEHEMPAYLKSVPSERFVRLDVRDDLSSGNDPFKKIMAALDALAGDEVLAIRNIIEPVPLYAVLGSKGFLHWTEKLGEGDWQVYFYRQEAGHADPSTAPSDTLGDALSTEPGSGAGLGEVFRSGNMITIDVRNLEPPEPFQKTMELVYALHEGEVLVQINDRHPQLLFPKLDGLGLKYEVQEHDGIIKTVIRK